MTTKQTAVLEPLIERVDRLARELELAIRWDRPSILLAVYSSMYVMNDAAAALAARLREEGQAVEWAQVTNEADADVPLRLANQPQREGTVFFVSGLQWGGKTALRALNIRREYFVDQRLRAVFWLTENEAVAIAREAPDFWAFRHRVVEFVEPPEPDLAAAMAREMAWRDFEDRTLREDTQAKIALREALLADLPKGDETLAAQAELQFTLGGLYWADRQYGRAEESFRAALEGARRTDNTRLEAWCHNGLGNVYHALGRYEEAMAEFQWAIELGPQNATPYNGLGLTYYNLGRHEEAAAAYQRAIELDPQYATPHNNLGLVYAAQRRYEKAVAAYQRAIELDPQYATPHNNLGLVYAAQGHHEKAVTAYQWALELVPRHAPAYFNLALAEVQRNNVDAALAQLEHAIALEPEEAIERAKKASGFDSIRHDPRFQELVGEGSDSGAQERKG
jgi:tetratricopeptide (TPR) repeat protein